MSKGSKLNAPWKKSLTAPCHQKLGYSRHCQWKSAGLESDMRRTLRSLASSLPSRAVSLWFQNYFPKMLTVTSITWKPWTFGKIMELKFRNRKKWQSRNHGKLRFRNPKWTPLSLLPRQKKTKLDSLHFLNLVREHGLTLFLLLNWERTWRMRLSGSLPLSA